MKKLLLGAVAVMGIVVAGSAQAQEHGNGGTLAPYVGLYGGYGWADTENSNGADPSPSGFDYGLYGGIQADALLDATVNKSGLGITGAVEVHYGWSGADDSVGGVHIEKGSEFGINFRPGLKFLESDSVVAVRPYAIIGYRNTDFEARVSGLTAETGYNGFELGLGTELVARDSLGVRLDYTHVWYGEKNGIDPDEDNLRLGVGYKFQ